MRNTTFLRPLGIVLSCAALSACAAMNAASVPKSSLLFAPPAAKAPLPQPEAAITASSGYFVYGGLTQQRELPPPVSMKRHVVYETMDNTSALDAVQFIESNCGVSVESDDLSRSVTLPPMSYQGACSGLMAAVTQGIGYTSEYTTYGVRLMRAVTRTFQLPVLGGKIKSEAPVGAKNSTGGTGGRGGGAAGATSIGVSTSESSVVTAESYSTDEWRGLLLEAEAIASPAQLTADEASATVTVTGTRADVKRFSRWVRSLSHRLQRQVEVSVQVYQVTLKNDENYGVAPGLVWKYLSGLSGVSVAAPSALTLSNGESPGQIQFTSKTGPFNGTQASVSALSQIGSVHQVYNNTLLALDGYPVTVNNTKNYGYLAEVSSNSSLTGGTGGIGAFGFSTLTPGNISAGVAMSITPRIADGNRIVLSMVFRDTGNPTFKTMSSGGESLQVPQESVTSFNQMVDMPSGSTVMLLGFRNDQSESQTQGTGSPDFWLLGGGHLRQVSNTITVVTISAKAS